jgi:hypothetical protein
MSQPRREVVAWIWGLQALNLWSAPLKYMSGERPSPSRCDTYLHPVEGFAAARVGFDKLDLKSGRTTR